MTILSTPQLASGAVARLAALAALALAALALAACDNDPVRPGGAAHPAAPRPSFALAAGATVTEFGTLPGGGDAEAHTINNLGQVAGWSTLTQPANGRYHAVRWPAAGVPQDLGVLGTTPESDFSEAVGSNDQGSIVGTSSTAAGEEHAFLWTPAAGMQDLGTLPGGTMSQAFDVNRYGQVVGQSLTPIDENNYDFHAFLWTAAGGMQDLGTLGGRWSRAQAINDAGQVVGQSAPPEGGQRAFLWTSAGGMQDLGTLGGPYSVANDVNAAGQVVGRSSTASGPEHAFLWTPGMGMQDLGVLPGDEVSIAYGVNDYAQVVGLSIDQDAGRDHAFVWTARDGMRELPGLGGEDSEAHDINNGGQVAGMSELASHAWRAVLWTTWIPVPVQVRPDVFRINASGNLRAAVLTTPALDARLVVPASATLGDEVGTDTPMARKRDGSVITSLEDVDGDGDLDRVLNFDLKSLRDNGDLTAQTGELVLRANLSDGRKVRGADRVKVTSGNSGPLP
jgi:probable HAF family extracellular repeat protein